MTLKWSKKECISHIVELKSPFDNMSQGNGQGFSPAIQQLRQTAQLRKPLARLPIKQS